MDWGEQLGNQTGIIKTGTGSKRAHSSSSGSFSFPPFSPFFSSSKNLPPHMVGNGEPHPPLERGWGCNRALEGYNEPPGLFQLQSD